MIKKIICIALIFSLGAFSACGNIAKYEYVELLSPIGKSITETQVVRSDIYNVKVYNGEVIPDITEYSFEKTGRVSGVFVKVGDIVRAGDLMAVLDSVNDKGAVAALEDSYRETEEYFSHEIEVLKNKIKDASCTWQKKELYELIISQHEKEMGDILTETAQELEEAEKKVILNDLYSQKEGVIIGVACNSGRTAYKDTPVIAVADDSKKYVICEYISPDTMKTVKEIYTLVDGEKVPLSFSKYDSEENPTWSYFETEDEDILQIGDYAPIVTVTNYIADTVTILKDCVYKDDGGKYVYVTSDGNRTKTYVTLGAEGLNSYEVISGLNEDDKVFIKDDASTVDKTDATFIGDFVVNTRAKATPSYRKTQNLSATKTYGSLFFNEFAVDTFQNVKRGDVIARYSEWVDQDTYAEAYFSLKLAELQKDYALMSELEMLIADLDEAASERVVTAPFDGMLISKERLYKGGYMDNTLIGAFAAVDNMRLTVDNGNNAFKFGQRVTIEAEINGKIVYGTGTVISASRTGVHGNYNSSTAVILPDAEYEYLCLGSKRYVSIDNIVIRNVVLVPAEAVSNVMGEFAVVAGVNGMSKLIRFSNGKKNDRYYWAVDGIEADTEVYYK